MVGYHNFEKMSNGYYLIGLCGVALTKYIKPPRRKVTHTNTIIVKVG
jgi:hypothetical protein